MILTDEQEVIVATDENLVIAAYAGTGKTSTLYHYIKSRKENSRILYIAFNKSVAEEAIKRFADIDHVFLHIKTVHSLAYDAIVRKFGYEVGFLKVEDVSKILKLTDFVMANHVMKMVNYFCGCADEKVQDIDYRSTLRSQAALNFFNDNSDKILLYTRKILAKMDKGEIPIIHDFYLKKWQLTKPSLKYDYILMDEGQDASECMLDVFNRQKGTKIIVGDSHQQIYSWRNAINSLEKVNFKKLTLSKSFRFDQKIADMAIKTIKWKSDILGDDTLGNFKIIGAGKNKLIETKAIIGRTNTKLIIEAIKMVVIEKTISSIYFEGGFANYSINGIYTIANDVIAIMNGNSHKVKTASLKGIETLAQLVKFINQTEDVNLAQAVSMVKQYGDKIIPYVTSLRKSVVEDRKDAEYIFTTVHKSKGMEYDEVILLEDFSTKEQLEDQIEHMNVNFKENTLKAINEEINLLYVAITRTKGAVHMSSEIFMEINGDKNKYKKVNKWRK